MHFAIREKDFSSKWERYFPITKTDISRWPCTSSIKKTNFQASVSCWLLFVKSIFHASEYCLLPFAKKHLQRWVLLLHCPKSCFKFALLVTIYNMNMGNLTVVVEENFVAKSHSPTFFGVEKANQKPAV